jgi:DNA-binding NtrC family response regulator
MAFNITKEKIETSGSQLSGLEISYNEKYKGIIGTSPEMKKVFDKLEVVKNYETPVLINGESGTGKELLAAIIHYNSPRKNNLFVIQSCLAISGTLLGPILFGQENKGLLEIADGGTLFLDEIGDMCLDVQEKLLRVLESGTFYREGDTHQQDVNTRIIVSTNKNLKKLVEQGLFCKDLYSRLNILSLTIPTLRERKEDITILINHFLESYAEIHEVEKKDINQDVIRLLKAYQWPGNVRELKNVVERMIISSGNNKTIECKHAPEEIMNKDKVGQ